MLTRVRLRTGAMFLGLIEREIVRRPESCIKSTYK
jgi:hypothetical protein